MTYLFGCSFDALVPYISLPSQEAGLSSVMRRHDDKSLRINLSLHLHSLILTIDSG